LVFVALLALPFAAGADFFPFALFGVVCALAGLGLSCFGGGTSSMSATSPAPSPAFSSALVRMRASRFCFFFVFFSLVFCDLSSSLA